MKTNGPGKAEIRKTEFLAVDEALQAYILEKMKTNEPGKAETRKD